MYTLITTSQHYVKIDMGAFVNLDGIKVPFKIGYLMKDQTLLVSLDHDSDYVKVILTNDISFRLDMNGVNGLPAKIDNYIPSNNEDLAYKLAQLRTL